MSRLPSSEERRLLRTLQSDGVLFWPELNLIRRVTRYQWVSHRHGKWLLTEAGRRILDKTACWA